MSVLNGVLRSKWESGRKGTGYLKRLLVQGPFFDAYLLKFPRGSHLPRHRDPLPLHVMLDLRTPSWWTPKHFRLNVVLQPAREGGQFLCEKTIFRTKRIAFFRPDKYAHSVTQIHEGTRYVLSFGFAV